MNFFLFIIVLLLGFISPLFSIILGLLFLSIFNKNLIFLDFFVGFSLATISYFFVPLVSDDAYRIFSIMSDIKYLNFTQVIQWTTLWAKDYFNYPIFSLSMYFVSKWFVNFNVFSFICVGISYSLILFTTFKIGNTFKSNWIIKLFFSISSISWISYLNAESGMRFTLASAISLLIVITTFYEDKFNFYNRLLFLIPLLIHPGIILYLLPFFGMDLIYERNRKVYFIYFVFFFLLMAVYTVKNYSYFYGFFSRFIAYLNNQYEYLGEPQKVFHRVVGLLLFFFGGFGCSRFIKKNGLKIKDRVQRHIISFNKILFIYSIILLLISNNFLERLCYVFPILGLYSFYALIPNFKHNKKNWFMLFFTFIILFNIIFNKEALVRDYSGFSWLLTFKRIITTVK